MNNNRIPSLTKLNCAQFNLQMAAFDAQEYEYEHDANDASSDISVEIGRAHV